MKIYIIILIILLLSFYTLKEHFTTQSVDIVYSIIAHESIKCINDLISNIFKFNKNYKIAIYLHLNEDLYGKYKCSYYNVFINKIYYDKQKETHKILKAHIDNFNSCCTHINFKYFVPLASNCMFIKQLVLPSINYKYGVYKKYDNIYKKYNDSWHKELLENKRINNLFDENKIIYDKKIHEGAFYDKLLFYKISKFIEDKNVFSLIDNDTCFEEYLLPSLENYFINTCVQRLCLIFWSKPSYEPSIYDIDNLINDTTNNIFIVKRIPRCYDNEVRKYIREL